ncbi:hypothetical protein CDAR_239111 [Caerostris darwini]|uniref:Uncharacterized protein n=1 Tax=Caerostris darwini TaxID=1538125 RepID=A0AAV4P085_9ARAC|nr:hypothetical protein CDAR_239111 [Caerostris darwini]
MMHRSINEGSDIQERNFHTHPSSQTPRFSWRRNTRSGFGPRGFLTTHTSSGYQFLLISPVKTVWKSSLYTFSNLCACGLGLLKRFNFMSLFFFISLLVPLALW